MYMKVGIMYMFNYLWPFTVKQTTNKAKIFVCWPASLPNDLPAIRPGCPRAGAPVFSYNLCLISRINESVLKQIHPLTHAPSFHHSLLTFIDYYISR